MILSARFPNFGIICTLKVVYVDSHFPILSPVFGIFYLLPVLLVEGRVLFTLVFLKLLVILNINLCTLHLGFFFFDCFLICFFPYFSLLFFHFLDFREFFAFLCIHLFLNINVPSFLFNIVDVSQDNILSQYGFEFLFMITFFSASSCVRQRFSNLDL